jgi:hypothetical protein
MRIGLAALGSHAGRANASVLATEAAMPAPFFSVDGPDSVLYGREQGYPVPEREFAIRTGNPWPAEYRVGAFSHLDAIYETRRIAHSASPWAFVRAAASSWPGLEQEAVSWSQYMTRHPVTGLLIAKDGLILFEGYQYGRTDAERLVASR